MKKNKKIIAICIIVLMIVLVVLLCILSRLQQNVVVIDKTNIPNGLQNKYPTNTIAISQQYKGNLAMNKISTTISEFMTGTIPFLKKHTANMTEEERIEYYNQNASDIKKRLGNVTEVEFLKLLQSLQELSSEEVKYESSEYIKDSIKVKEASLEVNLKIKYEGEREIVIKVRIPYSSYSIKFYI